tara:strand:+ start:183 stop:1292 length:1110 start_codon:yes stop_codon:yes gene_type:complete
MAEYNGSSVVIYYVDGGAGSDSNAGTHPTDSPWKTIQYAFDKIADGTIVDGDEVRIMKTDDDATNYGISAKLTCTWNNREVIINGCNASGVVDGTIVEINGDGLDSSTPMLEVSVTTIDYSYFSHLKFNAADTAQHCVEVTNTNNHHVTFINCQFTSATDDGVNMNIKANYWKFINCRADNNGSSGIEHASSNYGLYYKCLFDNNAGDGLRSGVNAMIVECAFFNNGDDGAYVNNSASHVCNCVFDNNTSDGLYIAGGGQSMVMNNVFSNNTRYGLNVGSGAESRQFNNAFYNNAIDSYYVTGTIHLSMYNYLDDVTTNWGVTADFDFTHDGASSVVGSGMPTHYKWMGSTADDIGLNKWVNTESINVF